MVLSFTEEHVAKSLENGDHLSRDEFHRRYEASGIGHAELVEGVVYLRPRTTFFHGGAVASLAGWIGIWCSTASGVSAANHTTLLIDLENELQPDVCLFREGGQSRANDDDYMEGAPELVAEVCMSSASIELHEKKTVYRRNGVKEYLVWRVFDRAVDWFVLEGGDYVPLTPDARGVIESRKFPGLRLAVPALVADDIASVAAEIGWPPAAPLPTSGTGDAGVRAQD